MYILDVIPLDAGVRKEALSYFSQKPVAVGTLVTVPVRAKNIVSIVIEVHNLADVKAYVKGLDFTLRNITEIHQGVVLAPLFVRACVLLKNYYATKPAALFSLWVPRLFIETYSTQGFHERAVDTYDHALKSHISLLQDEYSERILFYKRHIRTSFAQKKSAYIICPTHMSAEQLAHHLEPYSSERMVVLHSKKTKKYTLDAYERIRTEAKPILVIGTASCLSLPRHDIGSLIIEEEGSPYYRTQKKPYPDDRDFVEVMASVMGIDLIIADHVPRFSTLERSVEERWHAVQPVSLHTPKHIVPRIVSQKKDDTVPRMQKDRDHDDFSLLHEDVLFALEQAMQNKESVALYVSRKGLAPLTVCQDCGDVLRSPDTGVPLTLYEQDYQGKKISYYYDARAQKKYHALNNCPTCRSWRLKLLGIGVATLEKFLQAHFPDIPIIAIEGTTHTTSSQVKKSLALWRSHERALLIGNDKILPYLNESVDHVIIASLDSFLSLSGYTVQEKIIRLLMRTMELARMSWTLQTRIPHHPVFESLRTKTIRPILDQEMRERKMFMYPPYAHMCAIETTCHANNAAQEKHILFKLFAGYDVRLSMQRTHQKEMVRVRALIHIPKKEWIHLTDQSYVPKTFADIMRRYEQLSPAYTLMMNPENI
ncbi:MAG: hypothetical protein LRY41_03530 [Candidatus Pacebacteria bacterium]|nr:hypothetical protein [Candidatus Paceibacterota bacterium]MCD8563789.1 hypothetical protein [Candidatus Paceibacterota bacterium]